MEEESEVATTSATVDRGEANIATQRIEPYRPSERRPGHHNCLHGATGVRCALRDQWQCHNIVAHAGDTARRVGREDERIRHRQPVHDPHRGAQHHHCLRQHVERAEHPGTRDGGDARQRREEQYVRQGYA
eukprot:scaffold24214_cov107-Isochrysis_galbana.AAC.3